VIVTVGTTMVMAPTFDEALREAFGANVDIDTLTGTAPNAAAPAAGTGNVGTTPAPTTTTVRSSGATTTVPGTTITDAQALQQAAVLLEEADAALLRGDLATYQRKVNEARALLATKTTR